MINLVGLEGEVPDAWGVQGMLTLTLPSPDKNIRPNVILTKEYFPKEVDLNEYFERMKESILKRGIKDLKITDEREIVISGVKGKMMICSWDVSAMASVLGKENEQLKNISPGQVVKQVQITLIKGALVINMTASFPGDKFEIYYRPFQQFLKSLKITA